MVKKESIGELIAAQEQAVAALQENIRMKEIELESLRGNLPMMVRKEQRLTDQVGACASEAALRERHATLVAGSEVSGEAIRRLAEGKEELAQLQKQLQEIRETCAAEEMRAVEGEIRLKAELATLQEELQAHSKEIHELLEIRRRQHTDEGKATWEPLQAEYKRLIAERIEALAGLQALETSLDEIRATMQKELTPWPALKLEALALCGTETGPMVRVLHSLIAYLDALYAGGGPLVHSPHFASPKLTLDRYEVERIAGHIPRHLDGVYERKREEIEKILSTLAAAW